MEKIKKAITEFLIFLKKREIKILIIAINISLAIIIIIAGMLHRCGFNSLDLLQNTVFMLPVPATIGIVSYFGLEHYLIKK